MHSRVFSYGTLQQPEVQASLYGGHVPTFADALLEHKITWLKISNPDVIKLSGSDTHPALVPGGTTDRVEGSCLELTEAQLAATDEYESADYERFEVVLESGNTAWVYRAKNS